MGFQFPRAAVFGLVTSVGLVAAVPLVRSGAAEPPADSPPSSPTFLSPQEALEHHEFYFTRAVYSGGGGFAGYRRGRRPSWATDYPKADRQFMVVLSRLINIDNYSEEHAVDLADPNLRRFPFLYALEVGEMRLTDAQVTGLRDYLSAGGFLVVDDFWRPDEWATWERQIARVLPGRSMYELPMDHPVFNGVYDIAEIMQVPNIQNGWNHGLYGTPTNEGRGSEVPHVFGIDDDEGHTMVIINWNTDLGDAWEWAEHPYYPLKFSTYAFEMGINMIVYGMTH